MNIICKECGCQERFGEAKVQWYCGEWVIEEVTKIYCMDCGGEDFIKEEDE